MIKDIKAIRPEFKLKLLEQYMNEFIQHEINVLTIPLYSCLLMLPFDEWLLLRIQKPIRVSFS